MSRPIAGRFALVNHIKGALHRVASRSAVASLSLFGLHVRIAAGRSGRRDNLDDTALGRPPLHLGIDSGGWTNDTLRGGELIAERLVRFTADHRSVPSDARRAVCTLIRGLRNSLTNGAAESRAAQQQSEQQGTPHELILCASSACNATRGRVPSFLMGTGIAGGVARRQMRYDPRAVRVAGRFSSS